MCEHCSAPGAVQRRVNSPFDRVLAVCYCNGPTDGFLRCRACGLAHSFRLLGGDADWDRFVVCVRPLGVRFDALVKGAPGAPWWPVWWLQGEDALWGEALLAGVVEGRGPGCESVAVGNDLLGRLDVWAPAPGLEIDDWMSHFGLTS